MWVPHSFYNPKHLLLRPQGNACLISSKQRLTMCECCEDFRVMSLLEGVQEYLRDVNAYMEKRKISLSNPFFQTA